MMNALDTAPAPQSAAKAAWPLAAICCLGVLGFLLAATIVLALIPIYLPTKQTTTSNSASGTRFYGQYRSRANPNTALTGRIANVDEVGAATGMSNGGTVELGQSQSAAIARRKRSTESTSKTSFTNIFTFQLLPTFPPSCVSATCRLTTLNNYQTRLRQNFTNVSIVINAPNTISTSTYNLTFLGFLDTAPAGFNTSNDTVANTIFTASQSGPFNAISTWSNQIVPYGNCSVIIPAGINVSIALPGLEINVTTCDIFGTLTLGSANYTSFLFNYSVTITVRPTGVLQVLVSNLTVFQPADSINYVFDGGQILPLGVTFTTTDTGSRASSFVRTIKTRGQYTAGFLPRRAGGGVVSYEQLTFCSVTSGDFTSGLSYLGGFPPSTEYCAPNCGLAVQPNCILSTAGLNGRMTLQITTIIVTLTSTFIIGTPGSATGFIFTTAVQLQITGVMQFVSSAGGIRIPPGSSCNFLPGSTFTSVVSTYIQIYNPATGVNIGTALALATTVSGPYYITAPTSGNLAVSTTTPGANDFTSSTSTTIGSGVTSLTTTTVSPGGTGSTTTTTTTSRQVTTAAID